MPKTGDDAAQEERRLLAETLGRLLDEDAELLADPAALELRAAGIALRLSGPDAPPHVEELAVEVLVARGDRAAARLLGGLATVGRPKLAELARSALQDLRGRLDPDLPAGLGELRPVEARRCSMRRADLYLVRLARPGEERVQVASAVVEHEDTGGALVEGLLSGPLDADAAAELMDPGRTHRERAAEELGEEPDLLVAEPIRADEVAGALARASTRAAAIERRLHPELGAALAVLGCAMAGDPTAFLAAGVAAPGLFVDPDDDLRFGGVCEALLDRLELWLDGQEDAPAGLLRSGHYICGSMLDFKWRADGYLAGWTGADLDRYLLDHFPRRGSDEDEVIDDAPDAVMGVLRFLHESRLSSGDPLEHLEARVEELRGEFATAARDRARFGLAKSMIAAMRDDGVDVTDQGAIDAWIADFNARPISERDRVIGSALAAGGPTGDAVPLPPAGALADDQLGEAIARGPWPSDEELEQIAAEVEAEIRAARELLCEALAGERGKAPPAAELKAVAVRIRRGLRGGGYPWDWVRRAAGLRREARQPDPELLLACVAGTIVPGDEAGLDPDEEAAITSLEDADWLGAVVTAVRAGPGSAADPQSLAAGVRSCPELEVGPEVDPDDEELVADAFELVLPAWEALGVVDRDLRLTELGAWALPRGLARAWEGDFDALERAA